MEKVKTETLADRLQHIADHLMGRKEVDGVDVNATCADAAASVRELAAALAISTRFIELETEQLRYAGKHDAAKANEQQAASNWRLIEKVTLFPKIRG
jgi:hypothetical protein